jgi:hypothetical protein
MQRFAIVILISLSMLLCSCGKDHEGLPTGFAYNPLPTPEDLEVAPGAGPESLVISWSYPPEHIGAVKEFRIYYYYEIYDMVELAGTGTGTSYTDTKLIGNVEYCYVVSAVDSSGLEGWRTAPVCEYASSSAK